MVHEHSHSEGSQRQIFAAFLLNTCFVVIEIFGGLYTNSVAIISDALHDLGDSFALGAALYFERISKGGRAPRHTYGYRRYSVLGAVLNALVLMGGSALVIREAVARLQHPQAVHSSGMIILAILGIAVNGLAFTRIHAGQSQNVEVVRLHLLEDVLGWIAVLLGAIAIRIWNIQILDAILSIAISAWILFQVIRRLLQSLRIILQLTPADVSVDAVDTLIRNLPGVDTTHDTHLWTMDGVYHVLTVHVVLKTQQTMSELAQLKTTIRHHLEGLNVNHATNGFPYPG